MMNSQDYYEVRRWKTSNRLVLQLLHQTEDQSIRADSLELPITSTSDDNVDLYADELEQLLLLHQENQEIPEALTSTGQLGASNVNQCVVTSFFRNFYG